MKKKIVFYFLFYFLGILPNTGQETKYLLDELEKEVEIVVDQWGVPHIYAQTEADLFFAQGFYAAKDRLFQFEIWRRQTLGTVAEILGERELKRDIGTRLFKFRGDIDREMNHYHPNGQLIITSFVKGVNAYIRLTKENPGLLPAEFKLLNIKPELWTPEIVISRHQGLLGNIEQELNIARLVALIGEDQTKELTYFHPGEPDLAIDPKIDQALLFEDILGIYHAFRRPVEFRPEDLISSVQNLDEDEYEYLAKFDFEQQLQQEKSALWDIGSNNWAISGRMTQSGYPMMANDPHRRQAVPSLRYMAHLVGPGWNVIGGGEPEIPGISIGHNEYGAWGLTVFRTDAEDLYVYQTNPDNTDQYWYGGAWENMKVIEEEIRVKGKSQPVVVQLKYTRHGPVVFESKEKQTAFAVRCGWMEIGGSPYLASLRMDQAKNWQSFQQACNYSNIPGENMIWVDRAGNIGWQAVGIAPLRKNWSGLIPVPGDGTYEWNGYLPIIAKPNSLNPDEGYLATSNENVTPKDYLYMDAIGFSWSDPFRGDRVREVIESGRKHSIMDMAQLQTDYLSLPARNLVPLLKGLEISDERLKAATNYLFNWDFNMLPNSVAAGIYNQWEQEIKNQMADLVIPEKAKPYLELQLYKIIHWLVLPDGKFGDDPILGRDAFLVDCLLKALDDLAVRLGDNMNQWVYGQEKYKHAYIKHPLGNAVSNEWRKRLNVGPTPRGGNSYTVNNTSSNANQTTGASFRIIVDTYDWDHCLGTNSPGQNGNPDDEQYRNLFDIWAKDRFFPLFFSRKKIDSVMSQYWLLQPKQ